MSDSDKTVFISYRRGVSWATARLIFQDLRDHGFDVFMDVESIDSGTFDTIILNQIAARGHFVVILAPGTLERCAEPGDWLRREIERALNLKRNIVPVLTNRFEFDDKAKACLTGKLADLARYNGVTIYPDFYEAAMDKLRTRFLKQPVKGRVVPASPAEQAAAQRQIEEIASQPPPTEDELTAEEWFNRGLALFYNSEEEIACYTEAIRLNPQYTDAYYNRGHARRKQGDLDGAIADYGEAIRLNPQYAEAYNNRGFARWKQGDLDGAIADYTEEIRLNPQHAPAYNSRGLALADQGDLDGAIADYTEAIRLSPWDVAAYSNRGEVYFATGQYDQALMDFNKANYLRPGFDFVLAGLAITQHALGQVKEAKRLWRRVRLGMDKRYRDVEWVRQELNWADPLVDEARKLIARL
ncbi:MAG: tetratricopeptide repeat protein [Anaerolineae bacterium]|nr:tetratricopeptide repeat protein [Anaerolineae bacterium]